MIAASAGNHARRSLIRGTAGIPATVVMPSFAPLIKVSNCQKMGATVVMHGRISMKRKRTRRTARSAVSLTSTATMIRDHCRAGHARSGDSRAGARSGGGDSSGGRRRLAGRGGAGDQNAAAEREDHRGRSGKRGELFGRPRGRAAGSLLRRRRRWPTDWLFRQVARRVWSRAGLASIAAWW